jgi:hypothetical protein
MVPVYLDDERDPLADGFQLTPDTEGLQPVLMLWSGPNNGPVSRKSGNLDKVRLVPLADVTSQPEAGERKAYAGRPYLPCSDPMDNSHP